MRQLLARTSRLAPLALIAAACLGLPQTAAARDEDQPNILFILTDDQGYGDMGLFHQNERAEKGRPHHRTPNLDELALDGARLTRHYVSGPVCAPARASLLMGVHQGHASIRNNQFDKILPENHSLASVMKEAGYATAAIGKWGLQGEGESPDTWPSYPTKRGFDHFVGYVRHRDGHNHYPAHEMAQRDPVELYKNQQEISDQAAGAYTTDIFTAAAKQWIVQQQEESPDQPFFLYLGYDTPHAGLEVPPRPYPDGAGLDGGVQWLGESGRLVNAADPANVDGYFHPDYADATWDHDGNRDTEDEPWPRTEVRLATMIRRIDNGVGDLAQLLADLGIEEETMIVFTSDNGPHRESYGYGQHEPTFFDSFGPLDGIKRDTWEGGSRVPTWVRWPAQIPQEREVDDPSQFHDWLATFADAAGLPIPARADGVSLLPELTGQGQGRDSTVYIEYRNSGSTPQYNEFAEERRGRKRGQMQAIYMDGYKGIRVNIDSADDLFEIYDTQSDPGERQNLAEKGGEFDELQQRMQQRVLQLRRPNDSAPRPYDNAPVPPVEADETTEGLRWRAWEQATPWVPQPASLGQAEERGAIGTVNLGVAPRQRDVVLAYEGLVEVPEDGQYTFSLRSDAGAVLRLHEATLIDADRGGSAADSPISADVRLKAGLHPVRLIYARGEGREPALRLSWEGPGVQGAVPADRLYHQP
jgi:uncharacterized sulfatase